MAILKTALQATALTTVLSATFLYNRTKQSTIISPLSPDDPIFASAAYLRNNPHKNASTQDVCVRRVPASRIKEGLVEAFLNESGSGEGRTKLVESFCAGVWSGLGYQYQRRYLARKYRAQTPDQLWDREELRTNSYEVGTRITDHFEVVEKTPEKIVVRCGDSPLKTGLRDSDGLFEMGVKVVEEPVTGWSGTLGAKERFVEFSLKSCFYKGLTKSDSTNGPMPWRIEMLHRLYSKIWMETAIYNVMK